MSACAGWRARLRQGLRTLGWVAAASTAAPVAQAQQTVPAHWLRYALHVSKQLQQRLSDPADAAVQRLHGWMQERVLAADTPLSQQLVARLWIAADGRVERLEFTPLGKAEADADLRGLLTAQPLEAGPPADMGQPLLLQLDLQLLERAPG